MMLFHDATLPGRLQRCTTYLLLLRNAKSGLWLPRPFFFGLYPLLAPSCVPYRSRTVESNVSQSSLSSFQGINRLRYPHNPSDIPSTSFSFLTLLNNLVSVVDANGSLRTAKRSVNTPASQDTEGVKTCCLPRIATECMPIPCCISPSHWETSLESGSLPVKSPSD